MRNNNVLRDLIDDGRPTIGTHLFTQWPGMVEVIGHTGVIDYIEFSSPYAPYDLFSLENFGRAVDLFDHMSSMMKLDQEPRTYLAERAIGSGIQNVLFADIRTVEDAKEGVSAVRPETPEAGGRGGLAATRDIGYVFRARRWSTTPTSSILLSSPSWPRKSRAWTTLRRYCLWVE